MPALNSAGAGHYFASADYQTLYRQVGISAVARDLIHDVQTALGQEATRPLFLRRQRRPPCLIRKVRT
jgi:hypothetical protein